MKEKITLTLFCEKEATLISKIVLIFTRKKLQIDHFWVDICEHTSLYKIRIDYWDDETNSKTIVAILERIIEVFCCYTQNEKELETHQILLFKIPIIHKNKLHDFLFLTYFKKKSIGFAVAK